MRWPGLLAAGGLCLAIASCDCAGDGGGRAAVDAPAEREDPAPREPRAGREAPAPEPARARRRADVLAASLSDDGWSGTEPIEARRVVYRVHLGVPRNLGDAPSTIPRPAAELYVDVAAERLRARFAGPGWPVDAGSEVRLRSDSPGAYVFDAEGGRPLPPGQLADWFQGGPSGRDPAPVRVRPPPPQEDPGSGELICALLAEWSGQEREAVMRRCSDKGPPAQFRLGPWRAERTADVPLQLPRSSLRADDVDPPRPMVGADSRAFMDPALLARLRPGRSRDTSRSEATEEGAPAEGILIRNESRTRVVVTAEGVPVGWVDPGATGHFVGLVEGQHVIAGMRPLGQLALRPRGVRVPAAITVP